MSGEKLRFNLELSTISKRWHGEDNSGGSFSVEVGLDEKYIDNPDSHWVNEDIFSSYKNLLYRDNTQMDLVEIDEEDISKITIKLNKNTNYRYIYRGNANSVEDLEESIKKITLNGSEISAGGGTVFNTNEDLSIEMEIVDGTNWTNETPEYSLSSSGKESNIKKHIFYCIIE